MGKKYSKKKTRSRRKARRGSGGEVMGVDEARVRLSLPVAEILSGMRQAVESVAAQAGLLVMQALIEDEVERVTGRRYAHDPDRQAVRWGREEGYVAFAGRKVPLRRPRVRTTRGKEVALERYRLFQGDACLEQAVAQRVVCGVATRNYEQVLEGLCEGYGVRKSSVSRRWKAASAKQLQALMERSLAELDLAALLIDGIEFHEITLVVALGVDSEGIKHVLGLWEGATENAEVVTGLLEDLVDRGLRTDRRTVVVIDGSKALRKGVVALFGARAEIQRCQVHKERNILSHLPKKHHAMARRRLRTAWGMTSYEEAREELSRVQKYLRNLSESAARSLEEAFDETLTLHRLGVPEPLRKTLRSTNLIESCFAQTRTLCRNVKNWNRPGMALRWTGTMLLEAEKRFRRVRGYRALPVLMAALRETVDDQEVAA